MSTFIAKEDILSQDFQEKKTLKFIYLDLFRIVNNKILNFHRHCIAMPSHCTRRRLDHPFTFTQHSLFSLLSLAKNSVQETTHTHPRSLLLRPAFKLPSPTLGRHKLS